ncbi:transcription repressor OFP14-like [Mangifera indica]|uniref:transcription repressor OFP14-like n=1 Tax=Mangifera indica TaxID=29780 RepID=UPI001CFBD987|nr:transcription repressor OFP14-like [Mangifera indica]
MPKRIPKSLKKCLSKLKKYPSNIRSLIPSSYSFSNSKNLIILGCKQPRAISFALDRSQKDDNNNNTNAATLLDIDQYLYENFGSLYMNDGEDDKKKEEDCDEDKTPERALFNSQRFIEQSVHLWGSHPFFKEAHDSFTTNPKNMVTLTSPTNCSPNNDSSTISTDSNHVKLLGDSIAVLTESLSPYNDFRRSMQEMVEARLQHQATVDWDFLEKLLFCYFKLNEKKSYKFILRAFVDLVVGLREN